MNYLIISFILIIVLIIFILYLLYNRFSSKYSIENFQIANHILSELVKLYYENEFVEKNESLMKMYEIDPNSQINAIKSYQEEVTKLKRYIVKKIIINLSGKTKKTLYYFYSEENLVFKILGGF